jgi:hypothetical protein
MNPRREQYMLGTLLFSAGIALYAMHFAFFHKVHQTLYYFFMDVAFIPIQILIVGLFLERWLQTHERRKLLSKLNMVIGTFFSEAGLPLLRLLLTMVNHGTPEDVLRISNEWTKRDFRRATAALKSAPAEIAVSPMQLEQLRTLLRGKRDFLLRLLENPNLLEHEMFTELLLAVFHSLEELCARGDLQDLPEYDLRHLAGDMQRVYTLLVREWLSHMEYLKRDYPFLFSFAVRTNPLDPDASVTATSGMRLASGRSS